MIAACVEDRPWLTTRTFALTVRSDVDLYTYVDLGFHTGTTLLEYLDDVSRVVEFFVFLLGVHMKPSDIRISRLSSDELAVLG